MPNQATWDEQTLLDVELDTLRGHLGDDVAPTSQPGLLAWKLDDMVIFGFRDDPQDIRWFNWDGCGWCVCRLNADRDQVNIYHKGRLVGQKVIPSDWRLFYAWG